VPRTRIRQIRSQVKDSLEDRGRPGDAGWRANRSGTVRSYKSAHGPLGIARVVLKGSPGRPGFRRFLVIGRHGNFAMAPGRLPLKVTLVIDSPLATRGQCGETVFPASSCTFNAAGGTLSCR